MFEDNTVKTVEGLHKQRASYKSELANLSRRSVGKNVGHFNPYASGRNAKRANWLQAKVMEIEDQLELLGHAVPWYDRQDANWRS